MQNTTQNSIWNKQYFIYKFLPTALMLLLSAYINAFLRGLKDAVIVPQLGAELISFIQFYGIFPASFIFFIAFTRLANKLSRNKLYYTIILFFTCFFLLYAFVLNPFREHLQPDLSHLSLQYPSFKYQLIILENWTISLLYIMCEICSTATLALLFWKFTNDLFSVAEAKQTYAAFGIIGQAGIIIAGFVQFNISEALSKYLDWDHILQPLILTIVIANAGLIILHRWLYKTTIVHNKTITHKQKTTLSIKDSLRRICSSRYMWLIMLIVFCYGMSLNFIEIIWKNQLKLQYTTQETYSAFIGRFNMYLGACSIIIMSFGAYIIRKFKWLLAASITPIGAALTGMIFLTCLIFKNELVLLNYDVLTMVIILSSVQVILFQSLNFTFTDITKEMAFIPLEFELKTKGKAAVDMIGARFGRTIAALIQQLMLIFISPSISNLTYHIMILFAVTLIIWQVSVFALNRKFILLTDQ